MWFFGGGGEQHSAMTSRYMLKQPEIDYSGSCVGNAERKTREETFVDDDRPDRAWDRPRGLAADLAARPYTKAPAAAVAMYNWSGFYAGGVNGGWGSSRNRWDEERTGAAVPDGQP